ncbi:MAG: prefoldin subunit [Nanoarchaeota archaeon]|nr:prefoldin subunit [Nanoarchaeota archaeon]
MNEEQVMQQAQIYQQQIRNIASQKETINFQLAEIKNAKEELEKTSDDVFKISGPILIRTTKTEATKDLNEKEELFSVRLKSLETSEKKLLDKMEELRNELTKTEKKTDKKKVYIDSKK